MLGVKSITDHRLQVNRNFSLSPPPTLQSAALQRLAPCSQATLRFVDVSSSKSARSKRFGVEQELPKGRPRTIMQAVTAMYYTPGVGSRGCMGTHNLLNYVESASSTYAVQQIGSASPVPSTKLLLLGQGTNVFVADLAWSFDGYETSQIDNARNHVNGKKKTDHPLAEVADRLVRHDGYKDDKGKSRGVFKTRFMSLERWIAMVRYLSERKPEKAAKELCQSTPEIDPMEICAVTLRTLGAKSARIADLDDPTKRAKKDAEILEPLRRRFVVQIAPFIARDDTVAPERYAAIAHRDAG